MSDAEFSSNLWQTIDILEGLEELMEKSPSEEIAEILQESWLKISDTFPEDFKEATHEDAGAEGLRRYLKIKAFFENPTQNPISAETLAEYYQHRTPVDEETAQFFFPEG
jgi:hypothetical protein